MKYVYITKGDETGYWCYGVSLYSVYLFPIEIAADQSNATCPGTVSVVMPNGRDKTRISGGYAPGSVMVTSVERISRSLNECKSKALIELSSTVVRLREVVKSLENDIQELSGLTSPDNFTGKAHSVSSF